MIHATKLQIKFDLSQFREEYLSPHQKYTKVQKYARGLGGATIPHTETLKLSNEDEFLSKLPEKLLVLERPHLFLLELPAADVENAVLPAHVDLNKTCGINVYLEANGEVTKFYRWDKEERKSHYVEEFCAKQGDVWLMDTSTPHSVDLLRNTRRRMITFSFTKLKYVEVLAAL